MAIVLNNIECESYRCTSSGFPIVHRCGARATRIKIVRPQLRSAGPRQKSYYDGGGEGKGSERGRGTERERKSLNSILFCPAYRWTS
ncbi:hypothetical protein PUN28_008448 [Cardiocondyla obscurior]|uniref:Uncharacterized protein n=1 Tax=Cardiocondyla obscurior TaxID=286306 RepID=A0AAW2G404_9HYME